MPCRSSWFRIDGGRTLPQSDPTTKYKWGNVNKYVVHLGAGSPLKFHGVPASDRTLPRAMGRGTHLCFPDAGMLHKSHVTLAYLRNSAATRALWQNQRCHKLLPSGLKLHQKNDDMEARCCHNSAMVGATNGARRRKWPGGKSENCVFDQSNIQLVDYT